MRVSQLLKLMDKTDFVGIFDAEKPIGKDRIYQDEVRGIKKDDPVNINRVVKVFAYDDTIIIIQAAKSKTRGGE